MEIWQGDLFSVVNLQPAIVFNTEPPDTLSNWLVSGVLTEPNTKDLIESIVGVWIDPSPDLQTFVLKSTNTGNWPIGVLSLKIKFTNPAGEFIHTPEILLKVKEL